MKKQVLSAVLVIVMLLSVLPISAFAADVYADTVVYGTIRTAEEDNPVAEAIAIKDGKFIYVGNEAGVAAYIKNGVTKVIDHRGKGMVMPGCTDGHSHYTMKFGMENMKGGLMLATEDDKDELITVEQAFQALTINGAWQLGLENERGSIKVGKYAD